MAVAKGRDSKLGASVGLTDADLIEMYRYVALARAVDERMWILNRAGVSTGSVGPDEVQARPLRGERAGRSSADTIGSPRSIARSRRA